MHKSFYKNCFVFSEELEHTINETAICSLSYYNMPRSGSWHLQNTSLVSAVVLLTFLIPAVRGKSHVTSHTLSEK